MEFEYVLWMWLHSRFKARANEQSEEKKNVKETWTWGICYANVYRWHPCRVRIQTHIFFALNSKLYLNSEQYKWIRRIPHSQNAEQINRNESLRHSFDGIFGSMHVCEFTIHYTLHSLVGNYMRLFTFKIYPLLARAKNTENNTKIWSRKIWNHNSHVRHFIALYHFETFNWNRLKCIRLLLLAQPFES